ncbi:electron transporter SenC [Bradyrhizobium sp. NAS80.1]|uniref:SCO family protein n=1 Tax=Bradyrhizobium sp. NAS80.1 TaxID=1680159 RepID=UPI00095A2C4C|nr:SCO family protein [Bradyrhizobium sp. NAS80.1]OKO77724.1 electron transporter SenC [Bradyrhizobium sp. NAS80.1]
MDRRRELLHLSALGRSLCGAVLAILLAISPPASRAATSSVTIGGPFSLTAPDGATVTDQTYRGKWLLVYFGYTFCPNTCPTTLLEIAAALARLGPDAAKVQPIFITVDPKRDTPDVMAQYTQSFDPRIVGLTGTPAQIAAVAQEYGVYYVAHKSGDGANDYTMDHSTYLYVMDPQGKFVQAFDADTPADRIADDLLRLMKPEERPH